MFRNGQKDQLLSEIATLRQQVVALEAERIRGIRLDAVTGMLSARAFRGRLAEEFERARRYRRHLSLAVVMVDEFRALERRHGFKAGDELLVAVAERLAGGTRTHDHIGRTGASEFGLLLPETNAKGAMTALSRVLLDLERVGSGEIWASGVSMGVATNEHEDSPEALVASARTACEQAIASGGSQVMLAAEDTSIFDEEDSPHREAVEALAVALLERDRYTGEHSDAVIEMSAAVGRILGLGPVEVERVRSAARLHDIGKVGIPDEILNKPGPLTDEEWKLMHQHPVIGERILRVLPGLAAVAMIVRHEHERWDGTGYPDGLAGEEIPIGSRIILAADTYHAMTSDRPYRAGMPHGDAIDELVRCAGSQFDPRVTEALIGYLYGIRQAGALSA